jgi:hypothetical protein
LSISFPCWGYTHLGSDKNDLLTNVQFGEMVFFIDLIFATINYGDWLWDQEVEHLSIGLIFKEIKLKENGSFSSMNDELNYMNYNTEYFFLQLISF